MIKQRLMGRLGIAVSMICGVIFAGCSKDGPGPAGAGGEPRALVGFLGIEAAPAPVPPEQRAAVQTAVKWLEQAVAKVESVEQEHRRYEFALITDAARGHCGGEVLDVVRAIVAAIDKTPLPPDENVLHARLAATVAPYDVTLCKELLRQAIADGRRGADTEELWAPRVDVEVLLPPTRAEREGWRRLLQFRIELWECALLLKSDPPGAERRLRTLLETARKAGCTPADALYEDWLLEELASLAPRVVLAIWPEDCGNEVLAKFCYHQAYRRHTIARTDLTRARELVEPLPEKVRERVEFDGQENYLVGHPADSEMITGEYRTRILPQAARRIHRERGMEGVEELLSSLTDPGEKGTVLWKIAEKLVLSNEPELAESLLERIEPPHLFIAASCSLAQTLVEFHRREAI